ncbi:MAG: hypothetical protein RLZ94_728, partial [Actinomycetota bacterium]
VQFGLGVWRFLRANRDSFDIVHTHAFPFFGALAAERALRGSGVPIVVDWVEVWPQAYWREYAGPVAGRAGAALQARTARIPQRALISSDLHRQRLLGLGVRGRVDLISGLYDGDIEPSPRPMRRPPTIVFAGRHIPEKRVTAIPAAIALAKRYIPDLEAEILGDGPDRATLLLEIERHGLEDAIHAPGFVNVDVVERAIGSAACLLLPSVREGYGLVVAEAAARGTPSVVVNAPDNAAMELVEPGVNGMIAQSSDPLDLARAIIDAVRGGDELRQRTSAWANARGDDLTVRGSIRKVLEVYREVRIPT